MSGRGGIILASPVRQAPDVLREFLRSVDATGCEFWAYDDCDVVASRQMLTDFCNAHGKILPSLSLEPLVPYRRLSTTHLWTAQTFQRIAQIKDWIISQFMASDAEALFLVDSDILIHPELPRALDDLSLPVVSEVFWTRWQTQTPLLPQVWLTHPGGFPDAESIIRFRESGTYSVAGLGACTLIRRSALAHGLKFAPIDGLQYQGEDRHFCLRANVLGIPLHVNTSLPAFHVYREDDLEPGRQWYDAGCPTQTIRDWLDDEWALSVNRWLGSVYAHGVDPRNYLGCTEPWVTDLLVSLCRAIGAKRALEVGVFMGKTTAPLASVVDELVAIDREIRSPAINAVSQYKNVRLIEGDATNVITTLDGEFDFVYVDAGHDYDSVKTQTEAVWPKVRRGGVVAFHDVLAQDDDGVRRYLAERFPNALILDTRKFSWTTTGLALVTNGGGQWDLN